MKKAVILKNGGGELANQLWNYVSIYAYGIETGREVKNPSFFEYHSYFKFLQNESALTKFFSLWFKDFSGRRADPRSKFWRAVYAVYAKSILFLNKKSVVSSENIRAEKTYLSPTGIFPTLENSEIFYFAGWLFRNPLGLKKYRQKLIGIFAPNKQIEKRINKIVTDLRNQYERVIGVHVRQADYAVFKDGKYLIPQERVREILEEYVANKKIDKNETVFLITSDGPIKEKNFEGMHTYISKENAVTDLFLLSSCDAIIGSDSSFGAFASWYGNIPHILMSKEPLDWDYYAGRNEFFENKYSTLAHY